MDINLGLQAKLILQICHLLAIPLNEALLIGSELLVQEPKLLHLPCHFSLNSTDIGLLIHIKVVL